MKTPFALFAAILLAASASAQTQTVAHPGDLVGWDYETASIAQVANFKVCDTVSNAACAMMPPNTVSHVPTGTTGDPFPAAGFGVYAFPLAATTPLGPYNIRIQACNQAGVCSVGVLVPFTFALPAPNDPIRPRIITR